MNVLFYFVSQINPRSGGTERVTDTVAHKLRERGHVVYYMSRTKVEGDYDIPCFFLPDKYGITTQNIAYINRFCRDFKIDVVVNEAGNTDDIYLFSKEHVSGIRIVTALHFSPYMQFMHYYRSLYLPIGLRMPRKSLINLMKWIKAPYNKWRHWKNMVRRYRYMYAFSDKVVVLSPSYIREFGEIAKLADTEKLYSISNPNPFTESKDLFEKKKMVLSIGRLEFSIKKVEYLLRIWKKVHVSHSDWVLSVCGDGSARCFLSDMVKREKIKAVHFEGNVFPKPYYEKAAIICMTSLTEGMPMVVIEAMQSGCVPIVYDTFGAAKDMISDGVNGFIVPAFDKNLYAKRLLQLMENAELLSSMRDEAIRSSRKYDCEEIIDKWESLLV